jgi:prepilin-type N-terminal cleavage/methylation domain-containing protein
MTCILPDPTAELGVKMILATGQSKSDPRRAFTLVELILVMGIVASLVAVASSSLGAFFKGRKQDSEARRILSLIRYGQSRAVSEGVPALVWFDVKKRTYGMELDSGYLGQADTKSVNLEMDGDVELEVGRSLVKRVTKGRILPTIRLLPDGTIEVTSPEYVSVLQGKYPSVDVALSEDGLSYEIQKQNKNIERAFR